MAGELRMITNTSGNKLTGHKVEEEEEEEGKGLIFTDYSSHCITYKNFTMMGQKDF